jgi:hypothetical protein
MKRFKQYIKEKIQDVAWLRHTTEFIFGSKDESYVFIPLTNSIVDKITGNTREIFYHFCDLKNFERAIKLEGSKKSLSVTTNMSSDAMRWGIQGGGGIGIKLEGTLLAGSTSDILSKPDENGRRWLKLEKLLELAQYDFPPSQVTKMSKDLNDMIDELETFKLELFETKILPALATQMEEFNEVYYENIGGGIIRHFNYYKKLFTSGFSNVAFHEFKSIIGNSNLKSQVDILSSVYSLKSEDKKILEEFYSELYKSIGKRLNECVKLYIDKCYEVMLKHKTTIKLFMYYNKKRTEDWNEFVVNEIKIKFVFVDTGVTLNDGRNMVTVVEELLKKEGIKVPVSHVDFETLKISEL